MSIRLVLAAAGLAALSAAACSPADEAEKDAVSAETYADDAAVTAPQADSMPLGPSPTDTSPMPATPPPVDGSLPQQPASPPTGADSQTMPPL